MTSYQAGVVEFVGIDDIDADVNFHR